MRDVRTTREGRYLPTRNGWGILWTTLKRSALRLISGASQLHTMVEQRTESFMTEWIAAERARSALRQTVVYPNRVAKGKHRDILLAANLSFWGALQISHCQSLRLLVVDPFWPAFDQC